MAKMVFNIAVLALSVVLAAADRDLVVAIYGSGPVCATLAHALRDYQHIDLQYFDPALNLTPSAYLTYTFPPSTYGVLDQISDEASGAFERAGFFVEDPRQIIMGEGPDTGTVILDYADLAGTSKYPEITEVDPPAYLMQMLHGIDKKRLHANRTLVSIHEQKDALADGFPLELTFSDGTMLQADVLIGDDGPVGRIRSDVLGAEHPATRPIFMNFLSAVAKFSVEDAKKYLGSKFGGKSVGRRFEHIGQGAWHLGVLFEGFHGTLGSFYTAEPYNISQFTRSTTEAEIRARFGGFEDGGAIAKVLNAFSGHFLIPEIEHPHAPTYIKGNVAMTGAAAHHMTNFLEPAASQALEDAMVLGAVLAEARGGEPESIEAALFAYDSIRRPRSQWVSDQGKKLGLMWTGMLPDVGMDVEKLREAFLEWKRSSEDFDAKKHKEEALGLMRKRLEGGKPQNGGDGMRVADEL